METKTINGEIYNKVAGGWQKQPGGSSVVAPQRSFVQELVPTAGMIGGGILGGIGGTAIGGPVGAVAGSIAGAGIGGAGGEALQQRIEKSYGQRTNMNVPQIVGTGVTGSVLEATGMGFFKGAGVVANATRPLLVKTFSKLSGYADNVVEEALKRNPGAIAGVKNGEQALVDIVKNSAVKLQDLASQSVQESRKAVAEFNKLSGGGAGSPGIRQTLLKEGSQFVQKITDSLRGDYKIGVLNNGLLNFDRSVVPSNIVSGGDKGAIQSAFDSVKNITKDTSVKQLDAIMERLIVLKTKTPVGAPTGGETKQIIGKMMDNVLSFADSLGKYGEGYTKWAEFSRQNVVKRSMIEDMKQLFGSSRNLSPIEVSQISKRLLSLYNTGNLEVHKAAEQLGKKIGEDITGGAAGTIIKTAKPVSGVLTGGLIGSFGGPVGAVAGAVIQKGIGNLPRQVIKNYISTGKLTPELSSAAQKVASKLKITIKAAIQEMVNLVENKTTQ